MSRVDSPQAEDLFRQQDNDSVVDLKGSVFTLPVVRLQSVDLGAIEAALKQRLAQGMRFFEHAPVVIDVEALRQWGAKLDFSAVAALLRKQKLVPVGVRHATAEQNEDALRAGLAIMKGGATQDMAEPSGGGERSKRAASAPIGRETASVSNTKVVSQPVRSGQRVYAAGGDLIVLAPVNAGAEIIADGHIHVYAPLRGRALAGVKGDTGARIFARSMEAELVAIAGNFRVFEDDVPNGINGRPTQIYLNGEQLLVEPLN